MYLCAANHFKSSFSNAKKTFYRSFNSTFGKLGRLASEVIILHFVKAKCVPVLLYDSEACFINKSEKQTLDFVFTRMLMKLFKTTSTYIIDECYEMFNLKRISQLIVERKGKFLRNLCNGNALCALLAEFAVKELLTYNL